MNALEDHAETHLNIGDVLIGISRAQPDRLAIESSKISLSWGSMIGTASRMARALAAEGIEQTQMIGVSVRDAGEGFLAMIALWMLGATPVPIDFRMRTREKLNLATAFGLAAILEDRSSPEQAEARRITLDDAWFRSLSDSPDKPICSPGNAAPAYIALTSGSTGTPRGIVVDHDRLLMRVSMPFGLGARDAGGKLLNPSPLSFGFSVHNTLAQLLNCGSVLFFPAVFSVQELDEAIRSREVSSVCAVPTVIRGLISLHAESTAPAYPNLRLFYCAGAPLTPDEKRLARRHLTRAFVEVFASTVGGRISFLDSDQIDDHADSVGRVLPQVCLQIVDDSGSEVPPGEAGCIRVRGPGMSRAILSPVDRSSGDRLRDGWVYTGDIGRVDSDGFLYLLGRDSDMVIRGGENIYPAEIEAVSRALPGIGEVVVIGFESEGVGEDLALFFTGDSTTSEAALLARLRTALVPNKVPRIVRKVDALPSNLNGKTDRHSLLALLSDRR